MAGIELGTEWLDDLKAALLAGGIRSVELEAAKLNPPGVLIKPTGFDADLLAGYTATADLYAVVGDLNHERALPALLEVANKVLAVIDPAGPMRLVTLVMPDTTRLPALLIPFDDPTA